ncbi:MAG: hypothetical protein DWQ10_18605 [Calditrichaeota bacterium]|nr:MAG: hypothetical protein DWQ10_18605 [Calditrichota bacterium]
MKALNFLILIIVFIFNSIPLISQSRHYDSPLRVKVVNWNKVNPDQKTKLVKHVKDRYMGKWERISFIEGHQTLEKEDALDNSLLVNNGDLTIAGKIDGKAVVINGDVHVLATANVADNIVSINGKIYSESGAKISGELIETVIRRSIALHKRKTSFSSKRSESAYFAPESTYENESIEWTKKYNWSKRKRSKRWNVYSSSRQHENLINENHFVYRYNRVDGLFLGANIPPAHNFRSQPVNLDVNGFIGYGFAGERWRYRGNLELGLYEHGGPILGASIYDLTDSQDEWIIPTQENSLAAALIREDFQDYYRREGFGFYVREQMFPSLEFNLGYYEEDFFSLERNTNWSLFGGDKRFRHNPDIDEGLMKIYKAKISLDTRDDKDSPFSGWFITASGMWNKSHDESAYDYDRFILDLRRYIPLRYGENFDIRLRVGTGRGYMPRQHLFYLGGISTLRGFEYKDFAGDRLVLANIEYRFGNHSRRFRGDSILDPFNFILFFDTGRAWFADSNDKYNQGFKQLSWDLMHSNIGIALTDDEGRVRLNIAKSVDAGPSDLIVTFRINRAF